VWAYSTVRLISNHTYGDGAVADRSVKCFLTAPEALVRVGPLSRTVGRVAAGALLLGVMPLVVPSPALAAPAAPNHLTPDSTTVDGLPILGWSRVKGAAEYDVQISTSPDFSPALYDETTENSQATPTVNLPGGIDLYWRVRGVAASHSHGPWATAAFSQDAVSGPTPVSPDDGAQLQEPGDAPLLTWAGINGAISYTVEVDTDDQFVGASTDTVKASAWSYDGAGVQQVYYWHVKANFAGGLGSEWSDTRTFEILPLPAPDLVYPDDSSTTQIQDVVLDWAPVAGAVSYEVQASTDDQFNTTVINVQRILSTRYAPPNGIDNDQYWWRVRAVDASGAPSPWSTSLNQFQRSWLDQPNLVFPADGEIVSTPLFYEWDGVPHASSYQLDVSPDPSFSPGLFDRCVTNSTTFTSGRVDGKCAPSAGLTYWRVRPLDAHSNGTPINGVFSEIHSFTYTPGDVSPVSPANGTTVEVPTLRWDAYPGALDYTVSLKRGDGGNVTTTSTEATTWTPTGSSRLDPTDGPFHWTVRANRDDGTSTSVPIFGFDQTFDVTGSVTDDPQVAALTPTSAPGVHGVRPPTLTWEPWLDSLTQTPAAYYRVYYGHVGSPTVTQMGGVNFPYPVATNATVTTPDNYYWFVRAYDSHGVLLGTGPNGTFTIDPLTAATSRRVSLTGVGLKSPDSTCARDLPTTPTSADICSNLQQTPVLQWDPVPGAAYYMVYVGRDRELTNMVYSPTQGPQMTVNTMWNPTSQLADSQAGTAYYWFIRPCNAENICAPDPTKAGNAFDKRSNPVNGLIETEHEASSPLPAHGPDGVTDPPSFADELVLSWDDYLLTSQAGNGKDVTGIGSQVEAKTYKVEIGTDPNFSSGTILRSNEIDQASWSPQTSTLPEGPLYWRVQAVDGSGNALAWSLARNLSAATQSIEKRSPVPVLETPGGGETVSGTPAFGWDPLAYAAKYDVQIARNGDTTFSTGSIAAHDEGLKQTTYVPGSLLSTAGNPYVWRVRRVDASNRAGAWSAPQTFSVSAEAPTQIGPGDNALVPSKDALFTWLPVDGTSTYRFERRARGSTSTQETKSTTGLAWAPVNHISDGHYEWRVSSLDASNKIIGSSPWRPFRVDASAPTVIRKTPLDGAKPKAVFKVDFSEAVTGVTSATFKIFAKGNSAALAATVKSTNAHKSATLKPKKALKAGKTYVVKLLRGVKDEAGHPLKPLSWQVKVSK
jgi:Bacterial Ig-like domain